jgi:hypothetical protein
MDAYIIGNCCVKVQPSVLVLKTVIDIEGCIDRIVYCSQSHFKCGEGKSIIDTGIDIQSCFFVCELYMTATATMRKLARSLLLMDVNTK